MKVCIVGASGKLGQYMVQHRTWIGPVEERETGWGGSRPSVR